MILGLCCAFAVRAAEESVPNTNHRYQLKCMHRFFRLDDQQPLTDEEMEAIDDGHGEDVCSWPSVRACRRGLVTYMFLPDAYLPNGVDIAWLPSALEEFFILNVPIIEAELDTRALPRSLLDANFLYCGLRGSLELRTLPPRIENLDCSNNFFMGTVYITHLPKTVKRIILSLNEITKAFIMNESFPESLKEIQIYTDFVKVKLRSIDGKEVDTRIHNKRRSRTEYESPQIAHDTSSDRSMDRSS